MSRFDGLASEVQQAFDIVRHVTPETANDEEGHVLDGTCWCQPVIDYEDPVSGGRVFLHRRTLDSPHYEPDPARVPA